MYYYPLPVAVWPIIRYALLVEERRVFFMSWKRGAFNRIGDYSNDLQGQKDFAAFLKKNRKNFINSNVNIVVSLIGEDYRFEKTAHLVGKYKSDMIQRKTNQLFRGATYHTHQLQGREEIGRRQDMILFCGVLSNEKLQHWIRELQKSGMHVAGVHTSSLISCSLLKKLVPDPAGNHVISLIAEDNTLRHNFFVDGKLRFSRMSKVADASDAAGIYRSSKGEVDKTSQYLVSLKLLQPNQKFHLHLICADDLIQPMQQLAAQAGGSDRVSVECISAQKLCHELGVKRPISEFGRDSTPIVHQMMRSLFNPLSSLAPLGVVRFTFIRMCSMVIVSLIGVWAVLNVLQSGLYGLQGYWSYSGSNQELMKQIASTKSDYERQREQFETPPSTLENMEAAVNLLDNSLERRVDPGKMMLYVSQLLNDNRVLTLDSMVWSVSNEPSSSGSGSLAFASGLQVFQVIELSGEIDEESDPERAVQAFKEMISTINSRKDMEVKIFEEPTLVETGGTLVGDLDVSTDVRGQLNAFSNRKFNIQIVWDESALKLEEQA